MLLRMDGDHALANESQLLGIFAHVFNNESSIVAQG